jgi:hypothetical protein
MISEMYTILYYTILYYTIAPNLDQINESNDQLYVQHGIICLTMLFLQLLQG